MTRGIPTLPVLLVLFVACRDGPTQLAAPVATGAFTASAAIVTAVVDLVAADFGRDPVAGAPACTGEVMCKHKPGRMLINDLRDAGVALR